VGCVFRETEKFLTPFRLVVRFSHYTLSVSGFWGSPRLKEMTMFQTKTLVAAMIGTVLTGSMGAAQAIPYREAARELPGALGGLAQVSIIDRDTGRALPMYRYQGEYWVAGTPGAKYSIALNNQQGGRVLAVMSVDGVNVLTGATADVAQSGYVFNAYQRYDVAGWRKSDREIAAFEFVASPRSYAERTGRPLDVGVIGVALFNERVARPAWSDPSPWRPDADERRNGDLNGYRLKRGEAAPGAPEPLPAPAAPSSARDLSGAGKQAESAQAAPARVEPKLGTGHGAREWSTVSHTAFERATVAPTEVIRIRYDSRENLIAMGVIREPFFGYPSRRPNAFPHSVTHRGYVPDPPRW
jgi:hypothetical protein